MRPEATGNSKKVKVSGFALCRLLFALIGAPFHRRGVTVLPGIYFLGLKFLYKLKSAFLSIAGSAEDAAYLAEVIGSGAKQ
jgi:hypothetical protein